MAQVYENPDGTFRSQVGDTDITDMTYEELVENGVYDELETPHAGADASAEEAAPGDGAPETERPEGTEGDEALLTSLLEAYSSVPSQAVFTPLPWQLNLAENRGFSEHYLMYAVRRPYGSSYYWHYYLVLGRDISYGNGVYRFTDCDVYDYYSYNSTVSYQCGIDSGSVNGSVSLVYSDLYFDYVGVDPAGNSTPYLYVLLFFVIIVLIIIGGRRHV